MGLNRVEAIGHLGGEPEQRQVGQNLVLSFSVGVGEKFRDHAGNLQERTEWFRCEYWNGQSVAPYLHKGSKVYIDGSQRTEDWTDQQGQKRTTVRVRVGRLELLDPKPQGASAPAPQGYQPYQQREVPGDMPASIAGGQPMP